jgi:hypothetical protein
MHARVHRRDSHSDYEYLVPLIYDVSVHTERMVVNHSVVIPELIHAEIHEEMSAYVPSHNWFILPNTVCALNEYAQGVSTLRVC